MKKVFCNNEPYAAPKITLAEVTIERGFAQSPGDNWSVDEGEGDWDPQDPGQGDDW